MTKNHKRGGVRVSRRVASEFQGLVPCVPVVNPGLAVDGVPRLDRLRSVAPTPASPKTLGPSTLVHSRVPPSPPWDPFNVFRTLETQLRSTPGVPVRWPDTDYGSRLWTSMYLFFLNLVVPHSWRLFDDALKMGVSLRSVWVDADDVPETADRWSLFRLYLRRDPSK